MTDFLALMTLPFLVCLVLTGIHVYLGLHVIERQVIFVDLALAQIAAVGTGIALVLGHEPGTSASYWTSLGFTLAGAGVFSLTRFKNQKIPQEALIGIAYAVAASLLLVILSRSGEGDEHIRAALMGNVLLVRGGEVVKLAVIYGLIGAFHFAFRRRFLLISQDPQEAVRQGWNLRFWDFLFYVSFGIVVTSSVAIAGVLLVFSYLVVPASCAVLFASRVKTRLAIGWAVGFMASVAGMALSYFADLPTGGSVVCALGVTLLVCMAASKVTAKR